MPRASDGSKPIPPRAFESLPHSPANGASAAPRSSGWARRSAPPPKRGSTRTGLAAIRFLLLTGFRRMEGLGLQRAWLDEEEEAIRFPDTKSGAQTRVIGRAAIELLLGQPKTKSPYFFPADWGEGHFVGVVRVLDRVCEKARLADITPHTLRHTFASLAGDLGFSELTIAALLGHSARGVTQRYVHIDEALRMTADRVAGEMADILDGRATPARTRVSRTERRLEIAG